VPGNQYEFFAVGGVTGGSDPSPLTLSASLDPNYPTIDPFWFYTGSPWVPTYQDVSNSINGFTGYTDINVVMNGEFVPEPSTLGLLGFGIAGLALKLRRRK
jgi:hypothetical protein